MNKKYKDIFMYALAGLIITYSFTFLFFLLFKEIPAKNEQIVSILSGGMVVAGFAAVTAYFFGSTKGSSEKTEMIAKSSPPPEPRYEIPDDKQP